MMDLQDQVNQLPVRQVGNRKLLVGSRQVCLIRRLYFRNKIRCKPRFLYGSVQRAVTLAAIIDVKIVQP